MANPEFQAAIKSLRLPENATVVADCWVFGASAAPLLSLLLTHNAPLPGADSHLDSTRLIPFMVYCRLNPEVSSNHCEPLQRLLPRLAKLTPL